MKLSIELCTCYRVAASCPFVHRSDCCFWPLLACCIFEGLAGDL